MNDNKINNGFNIPKGYFDKFPIELSEKIEKYYSIDSSELQKEIFKVPDSYFEAFSQNIHLKLDVKKPKIITLNKRYYSIAASIAAAIAVFIIFKINTKQAPTFEDLTSNMLESYFDDSEYDFNENELAELLPLQEVSINDILNNELNQEEIVDYLDENITDMYELNTIYYED